MAFELLRSGRTEQMDFAECVQLFRRLRRRNYSGMIEIIPVCANWHSVRKWIPGKSRNPFLRRLHALDFLRNCRMQFQKIWFSEFFACKMEFHKWSVSEKCILKSADLRYLHFRNAFSCSAACGGGTISKNTENVSDNWNFYPKIDFRGKKSRFLNE